LAVTGFFDEILDTKTKIFICRYSFNWQLNI